MANTVAEQSSTGQVNTFASGMIKDFHPMQQPQTSYTDMLNGTLITYNDNEQMAQNDMGNYELKNAKLPEGYIPMGIKEYNGILYIISHNPETGKTQLGTYPSPRRLMYTGSELERVIKPIELPKWDSLTGTEDEKYKYILNNITGDYSYSKLTNDHQSVVFTNNFDDDSKLNINDCYELTETDTDKDTVKWQQLTYKVIAEDKATTDITDKVTVSKKVTADANDIKENVGWEQPGWISARYELDKPEKFDQFVSMKAINPADRMIKDIPMLKMEETNGNHRYVMEIENFSNNTSNYCDLAKIIPDYEIWAFQLKQNGNESNCINLANELKNTDAMFLEYTKQFGIAKFSFIAEINSGCGTDQFKAFITGLITNYKYIVLPAKARESKVIQDIMASETIGTTIFYTKLESDTISQIHGIVSTETYYDGGALISNLFDSGEKLNGSIVYKYMWKYFQFNPDGDRCLPIFYSNDNAYDGYIVPNTTIFVIKNNEIINIYWSEKFTIDENFFVSNSDTTKANYVSQINGKWSLLFYNKARKPGGGETYNYTYDPKLSTTGTNTDIYLKINLVADGDIDRTTIATKIEIDTGEKHNIETIIEHKQGLNINISKHFSRANVNKIDVTSVPIYKGDGNFIVYDNLAKKNTLYVNQVSDQPNKIIGFKYYNDKGILNIELQSTIGLDWRSILDDCYLYKFNGQLISCIAKKELETNSGEVSTSNTIKITPSGEGKMEPFYIFKLGDIYSGLIVPTVTKSQCESDYKDFSDFNLCESIKIAWPASTITDQFKATVGNNREICYIYVPEKDGTINWTEAQIKRSPIKPTKEMMASPCYFGMGILVNFTIDSEVKGCTWRVNDGDAISLVKTNELKPGVENTLLVSYNLAKFIPTVDAKKGEAITTWYDYDYLIKSGYCPVSMMDEEKGDQYNLAPLAYYAGWTKADYDGGSYLNIAKAAGTNPEVHVAVSHLLSSTGESNLNVSDRGPIYVGDLSGLEDKLPKNQLFYFVQGRVCVNKSGITVPFPMYEKENWYYNSKDNPRHHGPGVAPSVLTRESEWVAEKSCLNEYNSRIAKSSEIIAKQIGAGVVVGVGAAAILAGAIAAATAAITWIAIGASLIAAGGLIGLAIVAVAAVCAALVYGIKWLLGMRSNDRYFNAILLRNNKDRDGNISLFTVPVWSSRRNFPAYLMCENSKKGLTNSNDIDIAELRMILAMKRIYWVSATIIDDTIKFNAVEVEENKVLTKTTNINVSLSCSDGIPQKYNNISIEDIQSFVENYIGKSSMNFPTTSDVKKENVFKIEAVELNADVEKNSYADAVQKYITSVIELNSKASPDKTFQVDTEGWDIINDGFEKTIYKALDGFTNKLILEDGHVRFNVSSGETDQVLRNCKSCFGANSGSSWQQIWKERKRNYSFNDYLKIASGESPKADYTVIANPIYPSNDVTFLNPHKTTDKEWEQGIIQLFDLFGIEKAEEVQTIKEIAAKTPAKLQVCANLGSYEDQFKN